MKTNLFVGMFFSLLGIIGVSYAASNQTMCTMEYMPVCAKVQVQCIRAPCPPIDETFSNTCMAKAAGATDIRQGACEDQVACTKEYRPVCGEDNKTYGNACMAGAAGQTISYDGECIDDLISDFSTIVERAHDNGLTDFATSNDFGGDRLITREQTAKMLVQFSTNLNLLTTNDSLSCAFGDITSVGPTLQTFVTQSCKAGFFQGDAGKFWPRSNLTKAQALALIMRIVDGHQNENTTPWWKGYAERSAEQGLLFMDFEGSLDVSITRGELITWMYAVAKNK